MSAIGDKRDLQQVLNSVYAGAVKECEGREHEGKLVGNGHHMAQAIVENVKIELIKRGLFVNFDGPTGGGGSGSDGGIVKVNPTAVAYADPNGGGVVKVVVPVCDGTHAAGVCADPNCRFAPSFEELRAKNQAEGGCGCAPGTILCPH